MLFSNIMKKKFDEVLGRYEEEPGVKYYRVSDFDGLNATPFDIPGDNNIILKGFFYYYGELTPEHLIVFDHGIGSGHVAYLKEIETLAQKGYTVYSYDHTGCVNTQGAGIGGFAQGINDLDHVLSALQADSRFNNVPRKIMGHSWGGYACMNVAALHPEVTHIVSLAGFMSAKSLVEQYIPRPFLKYSGEVMQRERDINPLYTDMDARESLLKTDAHLLYFQSDDDEKVKFNLGFEALSQALGQRPHTELVHLQGKNHDPQRTCEAAAAHSAVEKDLKRKLKKNQLATAEQQAAFSAAYDWELVATQDPAIWNQIFTFLEK